MTTKLRRRNLCKAIELAWASLKTHLPWSIDPPKKYVRIAGDLNFHAKAISEYAQIILISALELETITRKRRKKH